jgi:hypothetical protein
VCKEKLTFKFHKTFCNSNFRISAFFRSPDLNAVRDIFARPFHADLWAAVFATWIVLAFFMILFSVIRKRYDLHNINGQHEPDFTHDS